MEALVRQAQAGERDAFGRLYEAFLCPIYRYLRMQVGDAVEAEDMTAQVFLNALQALPSYQWRQVTFGGWLFRIAHNLAIDHFRRRSRRATVPLDASWPDPALEPASAVELRISMEELRCRIEQLTGLQRQVVALRFGGDLSLAEVAQVLGRSVGAVKALQHAALTQLRRQPFPGGAA